MAYPTEFLRGFHAEGIAETCPYQAGTPPALAWLDGLSAARDRDRDSTLAGFCLAFAVMDRRADIHRAIYRYPGEAITAADALDDCQVIVVQVPAHLFEPEFTDEVETEDGRTFRPADFAGKGTDLLEAPDRAEAIRNHPNRDGRA